MGLLKLQIPYLFQTMSSPITTILFTLLIVYLVHLSAETTVVFESINPINQGKWIQGNLADLSTT